MQNFNIWNEKKAKGFIKNCKLYLCNILQEALTKIVKRKVRAKNSLILLGCTIGSIGFVFMCWSLFSLAIRELKISIKNQINLRIFIHKVYYVIEFIFSIIKLFLNLEIPKYFKRMRKFKELISLLDDILQKFYLN